MPALLKIISRNGPSESPAISPDPEQAIDNVAVHFFTDDHGHSLLQPPTLSTPSPNDITNIPFAPFSLKRPNALRREPTSHSIATHTTVVPRIGRIDLTLLELCDFIEDHISLQYSRVIATECYTEACGAVGVNHRFLIIELSRGGRKDVFLRLDRRRAEGTSLFKFFSASASTKANDRALIASSKEALVGAASLENRQTFTTSPMLHDLGLLLRIVCDEMTRYKLWPANCWFFCSLIQQHLKGTQNGWFTNGSLKHASLAQDIREKVAERYQASRDMLFSSTFIDMIEELRTNTTLSPASPPRAYARSISDSIRQWRTSLRHPEAYSRQDLLAKLNDALHNLPYQLRRSGCTQQAIGTSREVILFHRALLKSEAKTQPDPTSISRLEAKSALALSLHVYARCLKSFIADSESDSPDSSHGSERKTKTQDPTHHEASSTSDEECTLLLRQIRNANPALLQEILKNPLFRLDSDMQPLPERPTPLPVPLLHATTSSIRGHGHSRTASTSSYRHSPTSRTFVRPGSSGSGRSRPELGSTPPRTTTIPQSQSREVVVPPLATATHSKNLLNRTLDFKLPIDVLIVEDNPINATIMATFMRKKHVRYEVAVNGQEAVEKWQNGDFHIIFMDLQMPVLDGWEATRQIRTIERSPERASKPSVIIIALTASTIPADKRASISAGCNDFMVKPIDLQWLGKKLVEWGSMKALQMWAVPKVEIPVPVDEKLGNLSPVPSGDQRM